HAIALDAREAADRRRPVKGLELVESRAVDDPRDDLANVVLRADVSWDDRVELLRVARRRLGLAAVLVAPVGPRLEPRDDIARGRGTRRPAGRGSRRPSRRGKGTEADSRARSPARADASSRSSGSTLRPSPSRRWRRSRTRCR